MSTAIATTDPWSPLYDSQSFRALLEVAKGIDQAGLIPSHLRGQTADIVLALAMARAMQENPILVLQSIYVVSGRAGWSAQYLIARANGSGRFRGGIRWREEGEGDSLAVTALATLSETGEEVSYTVDMATAHAEGWSKRNPKYRTMPKLMLRYRSATLLVRLFCPDVLMGLHERYELVDSKGEDEVTYEEPQQERPPEAVKVGSPEPTMPRELRERPPERKGPRKEEPQPEQVQGAHPSWPESEQAFTVALAELGMELEQVRSMIRAKGGKLPELMDRAGRSKLLARLASPEVRAAYDEHTRAPWGEEQLIEAAEHCLSLGGPTCELVARLANEAGLPMTKEGPHTDGAPIPALRRFLHSLRAESRKVGA